jgi:hypothetical protein
MAATEAALEEANQKYEAIVTKLNKFCSLLKTKGDEEFPASKLLENLKKIV